MSSDDLSPELMWEILWHLSHNETKHSPPFYCQQSEASNEAAASEQFFHATTHEGQAIYSLHQMQQDFIRVLETNSDDKMSTIDIMTSLGLKEQHVVKTVGDLLCDGRDENIIRVEGGFALRGRLLEKLANHIKLHCGETYPTLEAIPEDRRGGLSIQQLSTDFGLAPQDMSKLLHELFRDDGAFDQNPSVVLVKDEVTGQIVEIVNRQVLDLKKQLLEMQVLSALSDANVPLSVSFI
jgi:hypothetical protein